MLSVQFIISFSLIILLCLQINPSELLFCPNKCYCENSEMVDCEGAHFEQVPNILKTKVRILRIKNSSISIIQKGAFKRYTDLKELIIENCDQLHTIEKFAFKGLSRLKLLRLANNPTLNNIAKNAFSQITNRHGLRIQLINNSFSRIRQGLFRQLNHLREFTLQGENLKIEVNAFASFTQVDFFNLFGVISFGLQSFENTSRIHRLEISHSQFSITAGVFTALSHIREIHIISNEIDTIDTEAFTGLYTIGSLIITDNKIGNISGYAFATIVNIGEIIIERNTIRNLETEALISEAWQIRFQDNILYCSCAINWLSYINNSVLLKKNFCGAEEFHRSLLNYKPNCLRPKRGLSATIITRTRHFIIIFCLFIVMFYHKTI